MELSSVIKSCHGVEYDLSWSCPLSSRVVMEGVVMELPGRCPQSSRVVMELTGSCHGDEWELPL